MEEIKKCKNVPKTSFLHLQLYEALMNLSLEKQKWKEAEESAIKTVDFYREVFPYYYPIKAIRLAVCGKLAWYRGDASEAASWMQNAKEILDKLEIRNEEVDQILSQAKIQIQCI